jgi:hypothetical protein
MGYSDALKHLSSVRLATQGVTLQMDFSISVYTLRRVEWVVIHVG